MEQDALFAAQTPPIDDSPATVASSGSHVPLATRMRPRTLDEYVGNADVIGEHSIIRQAVAAGRIPSLIFWGPPGSGKTTLAHLIAAQTSAAFEALSAVSAGVADIRQVVARAAQRRAAGRATVLFIDEIHRFNKGQQDAILPHVESGLVTLLGATTENPSHEVNAALRSRARVVHLDAHGPSELRALIERALTDKERGLGAHDAVLDDDAMTHLVDGAGGDARIALDALEIAVAAAQHRGGATATVSADDIDGALQQPSLLFDRNGDQHFWTISALIKSIRGSDPDAAVYWLARLLESGEDVRFIARRLILAASEDVGLADPRALEMAVAAMHAVSMIGMPEGYLPLAQVTVYLAACPKSNSVYRAYGRAIDDVRATLNLPVPLHLRNVATATDRASGFGGYVNSHDDPNARQEFLPTELRGRRYYEPTDEGIEARIAERVRTWRERNR